MEKPLAEKPCQPLSHNRQSTGLPLPVLLTLNNFISLFLNNSLLAAVSAEHIPDNFAAAGTGEINPGHAVAGLIQLPEIPEVTHEHSTEKDSRYRGHPG
ncbi:hypothetical protein QQ96_23395 [Salmonella enterica subsp. enterica serovar Newport]|nr:hypothetical protein [Salmonella enterica subsp. enterica serovar Newport]